MKKIIVCLGIILAIIVTAIITAIITANITAEIITAELIENIEVDGVFELDEKTITLKINGEYYDYEVEECYWAK